METDFILKMHMHHLFIGLLHEPCVHKSIHTLHINPTITQIPVYSEACVWRGKKEEEGL